MPYKNPADRSAANRAWRNANRDKVRSSQRVKALRREYGGTLTTPEFRFIMSEPCAYCGADADQLEHVQPLSRDGTNDAHNCVSACFDCNAAKHRATVLEFLGLWPTADTAGEGVPF